MFLGTTSGYAIGMSWFLMFTSPASASCLNCWFSETGDGQAWVAPFFVIDPANDGAAEVTLYGSFGWRRFDVTAGWGGGAGWGEQQGAFAAPLDVVPRWWFVPGVGIAAHTLWVPGETSLVLGPELHVAKDWEQGFLYGNVAWAPRWSGDGVDAGDWWADVSPGYNAGDRVQLFLEFYLEGTPGDDYLWGSVNPGFSVAFDADWVHSVALGVVVPVVPEPAVPGIGGWYSYGFAWKQDKTVARRAGKLR
jgi:hypothetical protein